MDGIIIINKPSGCTSHDIVYEVKKILKEKVGHTGTLDPMATGVLPLLIGKGTLCSKYLINHNKVYKVKLKLGEKTDTGDIEGNIINKKEVLKEMLYNEHIDKILKSFIGKQEQIPPIYSAVKVNGRKLYEYARKGEKVEVKPRKIEIYDIQLLKIIEKEQIIEFNVSCSKGTYIRSLCENIAERLKTAGYMAGLERIQVGNFHINQAITIEEMEKNISNKEFFVQHFMNIETLFKNSKKIYLSNRKLQLFLNGVKLTQNYDDGVYRIYCDSNFIGLGIIQNNLLKRDVII